MSNTLWITPRHFSGKIIRAVAAVAGVPVELPTDYVHFVDNKKSEFLSKFPHGKIPAYEQADGFKVFENAPIARHIAAQAPESGLLGSDANEFTLIDQWVHLTETEVDIYTGFSARLVRGALGPYSKPIHDSFIQNQLRALQTINKHLETRTFLVGDRITLADIYLAGTVLRAVTVTVDAAARAELPHIIRHLEFVVNQPKVKDILGPIAYSERALPEEKKEPK